MAATEAHLRELCDDEYALSRLVVQQIAVPTADYASLHAIFPSGLIVTRYGIVEIVAADWVRAPTVTVCAPPPKR